MAKSPEELLEQLSARYNFLLRKQALFEGLEDKGCIKFAQALQPELFADKGHLILDEFLRNNTSLYEAIFAPRGTGKTTFATRFEIIKRLIKYPERTHLIYSSVRDNSKSVLFSIKRILANNMVLKTYLPNMVGSQTWNKEEVDIAQYEEIENPDNVHSIETGGVDAAMASKHYDYIWVEDIIGKENAYDSAKLENVKKSLSLLFPLLKKPHGEFHLRATRWGLLDIYRTEIFEKMKDSFNICVVPLEDTEQKGKSLFPSLIPDDEIENIKKTVGPYIYSCHYQQDPKESDHKLMDFNQIKVIDDKEYGGIIDDVITGKTKRDQLALIVDSASTVSETSNCSALTLWKYDEHTIDLLDIYKVKYVLSDLARLICNLVIRYNLEDVYIEKSGAEGSLKYILNQLFTEAGKTFVTIHDLSHENTKKNIRIVAIQPYIDKGSVRRLPVKVHEKEKGGEPVDMIRELQIEMSMFPMEGTGAIDDLLDTLGFVPVVYNLDTSFMTDQVLKAVKSRDQILAEDDAERYKCGYVDNNVDKSVEADEDGVIFL